MAPSKRSSVGRKHNLPCGDQRVRGPDQLQRLRTGAPPVDPHLAVELTDVGEARVVAARELSRSGIR